MGEPWADGTGWTDGTGWADEGAIVTTLDAGELRAIADLLEQLSGLGLSLRLVITDAELVDGAVPTPPPPPPS